MAPQALVGGAPADNSARALAYFLTYIHCSIIIGFTPPRGRVDLTAQPPHLVLLLTAQAIFALAALVLYRRFRLAPDHLSNYSRQLPAGLAHE